MSYSTEKTNNFMRGVLWIALIAGLFGPVTTVSKAHAVTVPITPPYWIADIYNGTQSASVDYDDSDFHVIGTHTFFCALEKPDSRQIWVEQVGFVQRVPIVNGNGLGCPNYVGALNGVAIYQTQDPASSQYTFWRSDGTVEGTHAFYTVASTALDYGIRTSAEFSNSLYFSGNYSLWRTDGTAQGTLIISNTSSIYGMATLGGSLYFATTDYFSSWELWRSDGTAEGMQRIKPAANAARLNEINQPLPSPTPRYFPKITPVNGNLFISTAYEIWISDGTSTGTVLLASMNTSPGTQFQYVAYKNQMAYIVADFTQFPTPNNQLWLTDGTLSGTRRVTDAPTNASLINAAGDWLYLTDATGTLWKTNGNTGSIQQVTTLPSQPLITWQNQLLFRGHPFQNSPALLMVTDGTPTGTHQLLSLPLDETGATITAHNFADANGKLLFWDTRPAIGTEPYISDGTDANTHLLRDINTAPASSDIAVVATAGQNLYFMATHLNYGRGLWRTQGNPNDAVFLHELRPSAFHDGNAQDGARFARPTPLNTVLLYAAPVVGVSSILENAVPYVLWRSDGSPSGTYTLTDESTPIEVYDFMSLKDTRPIGIIVGSDCYFVSGQTLWRTDGTREGTTRVKQFDGSFTNQPFVASNGILYFVESTVTDMRLWRTDGTEAGSRVITTATYIRDLFATSQTVFFSDYSAVRTTDGTPTGTVVLHGTTVTPTEVSDLTLAGDNLFFVANDGIHGRELWRSDGSITNTAMITDFTAGISSTFPSENDTSDFFVPFGAKLIFGPPITEVLTSLWVSDGTAAGTQRIGNRQNYHPFVIGTSADRGLMYYNDAGLWQTNGTLTGTLRITDTVDKALITVNTLIYLRSLWPSMGQQVWWKNADSVTPQHLIDLPMQGFDVLETVVNDHLVFQATDDNRTTRLMAWPLPQPTSAGVDVSLQVPTLAPINEAGKLNLPITLMNSGQANAQPITLTLELGDGMTYASDTSGHAPQVQGNQVRWQWSELSFLSNANFTILLQAPRGNLGARSPFTLTVQSAQTDDDPSDNLIHAQAWTTTAWYLPIAQR